MPLLLNDNYVNRRKYRNNLKEMQDFPCEFEQMVIKCNILPSASYKYLSKGQTDTAQRACLSIYK